jgi:hypothetical protein
MVHLITEITLVSFQVQHHTMTSTVLLMRNSSGVKPFQIQHALKIVAANANVVSGG